MYCKIFSRYFFEVMFSRSKCQMNHFLIKCRIRKIIKILLKIIFRNVNDYSWLFHWIKFEKTLTDYIRIYIFLFCITYHIQVYLRKSQTRQLAVIKFAYKQNSSFCIKSSITLYVLPKKSCVLSRFAASHRLFFFVMRSLDRGNMGVMLKIYITSFVCAAVFLMYWSAITPSNLCRRLEFSSVRCSIQKSVIHLLVQLQAVVALRGSKRTSVR